MKKRILILNFGGLGDQILFFPMLETLKEVFNKPFITFVTESRSKAAIKLTDCIDEMFICDLKSRNKLIEVCRFLLKAWSGRYDLVISSGSSKFIPILLFLTGIKRRIGYDSGLLSKTLLTDAVHLDKNQYASDMYHDLISPVCSDKELQIPKVKILLNAAGKKRIDNILGDTSSCKKVVIHPGVSKLSIEKGIVKYWSVDNWIKLTEKLLSSGNYKVILTGGQDDKKVFEKLREKLAEVNFNKENLIDLTDKISDIQEFAYVVSVSDVLVCVDSAPMHIAVGLKKPVLALFGPTDEAKLLPANNELFTAIKTPSLECRPCLWDKRQTSCEKLDCLNIDPEQVFKAIGGITKK